MGSTAVMEVKFKSASAVLKVDENGQYWLTRFFAKERGQGHGAGLMKEIEKIADDASLELFLVVNPYNERVHKNILGRMELISFYQRHGFQMLRWYPKPEMVRPRKNN